MSPHLLVRSGAGFARAIAIRPDFTRSVTPKGRIVSRKAAKSSIYLGHDHLVLFGLENLRRTVSAYRDFHNEHRPHQGIGQRIPTDVGRASSSSPVGMAISQPRPWEVACTPFLGGLLKSYSRKAA